MMATVFFLAFLAVFWLLLLLGYWLLGSKMDRKSILMRWEWYRSQSLWPYGLLKPIFLFLNGQVLYPLRGSFLALSVIGFFFLLQSI